MKLSAARLQSLNRLLAEGLELPAEARERWMASLPPELAPLRPTLEHLLCRAEGPETGDLIGGLPPLDGPDDTGHAAGDRVGPYRLLRPLGEGGMGTVWLAERADGTLRRRVALKLPLLERQPLLRQRMARERDILAALEHPGIARLYDAGVDNGQPWLALEYVDGEPIDAWCRARRCGTRERLRLFLQVAQAVAHAHAQLVLHRDLKPANILVDAGGRVHLLDFGIAKLLQPEGDAPSTELTQQAGQALTLAYASPEQILGRPLGVASDVYTLGVVLCELLAGERPYRLERSSRAAFEEAIVEVEPRLPSQLAPALRRELAGDLDTIVAKALRKAPAERYASAAALIDDLERHLDGRPVLARPASLGYRLRKAWGRHRLALGAAAAVLLAVAAGSAVALVEARNARQEARRAQAVQGFLTDVFRSSTLDQPDPQQAQATTARELLLRGARQIDGALAEAPRARADVLATLGGLMNELGLDADAARLQRQRVALERRLSGPQSPALAQALLALTVALSTTSERTERDAALAEAGRIVAALRSPPPALLADLLQQQAEAAQYRDWPASARLAREAAAAHEAASSPRGQLAALRMEAVAATELRDFDRAERSLRQAIALARQRPDRPADLPGLLTDLSDLQSERMEIDAADATSREAVDAAREVYGAQHDHYAESLILRATFLAQAARRREALPLLEEAVAIRRRVHGDADTFQLPKALALLGVVLADYGRVEEGARHLDRVVVLKSGGEQNLAVAAFLLFAAHTSVDVGQMQRARGLLDRAGAIIAAQPADAARQARQFGAREQARWLHRMERPAEALAVLEQAGEAKDVVPASRAALGTHVYMAELQAATGRTEAARRSVEQSRQAIRQLRLGSAADREAARLDTIEAAWLPPAEAEPRLRRALAVRLRISDPQSPEIAESQVLLAQLLLREGQRPQAAVLAREARTIFAVHPSLPPNQARLARWTSGV